MKKIGLFYAAKAEKTSWVAERIQKEFGESHIKVVPIEQAWQNDFAAYDCFIVGASTWFDGELPTYWDELLPELRTMDLKGKKVAIFGLGDQVRYPENFADGIGLLAEVFEEDGAALVGFTSSEDILLSVPEHCVAICVVGWLSTWIISRTRQKRKSRIGVNK